LDVGRLVQSIDAERLRAHVAHLSRGDRHPIYSADRHAVAAGHITAALEETGLPVRVHAFTEGELEGRCLLARFVTPYYSPYPPLNPLQGLSSVRCWAKREGAEVEDTRVKAQPLASLLG
jgi:hypothetical protein